MNTYKHTIGILILSVLLYSCEWEQMAPPPILRSAESTASLEVEYTASVLDDVDAAFWNESDYLEVSVSDIINGQLEDDGLLNRTGLFNGISDFNNGLDPELSIKAAYNNENIYILATWKDDYVDASNKSLLWNGPTDEKKPNQGSTGWTSQRNDDNIILNFEYSENTSKKDIWKWSTALSEPFGYAFDMFSENNEAPLMDAGEPFAHRNSTGTSNRKAPLYEWNGEIQKFELENGETVILDPAYYLINKIDFVGDVVAGEEAYIAQCIFCHGDNGDGQSTTKHPSVYGPSLNNVEWNRDSREALVSKIEESGHDGSSYFSKLNTTQVDDLFARMRSFSGVPGYYLSIPSGSIANVITYSNLKTAGIKARSNIEHKVLFVRKLNTGNTDDIVFNSDGTMEYNFTVNLTDNDELNYIGSITKTLTFKPQE